ncbi:hypothetical protein HanRHA438_Chr14g0656551 [Helianthus annuus]|nr:hypothetical protein HanRHA438_Chr14g0656551 [Helianthus annuus]
MDELVLPGLYGPNGNRGEYLYVKVMKNKPRNHAPYKMTPVLHLGSLRSYTQLLREMRNFPLLLPTLPTTCTHASRTVCTAAN